MVSLPRIVIAAAASGGGKTTITSGLLAALRRRGTSVAPFKVGPDYIDPGYHALASGRVGRNLDSVMCGAELMVPLLLHGSRDAEVAVIEGVMGLFDGRLGTGGEGSTAEIARLTDSPVVLVADCSKTSRTLGAVVHGLASYDPRVRLAGVILNKVASPRHAREVVDSLPRGVRVLGEVPRDASIEAPSRHLGLIPVEDRADSVAHMDALADRITDCVDLEAVLELAHTAPELTGEPWRPDAVVHPPSQLRPVVAIAGGRAFTFRYAETEELLRAAGCEPIVFDPLHDVLPDDVAGLYLGGGFPEVHASELTANEHLRTRMRELVARGVPTVAECAGLLYLCREVDGHEMVGAIDATATMRPRLTMGYRRAVAAVDTLLARAGEVVVGHEFHRTALDDNPGSPAWLLDGRPDGVASATLHASYLHLNWAGCPDAAQRFANAVHACAGAVGTAEPDLSHHGDAEVGAGLADFAVNVARPGPPPWLADELRAAVAGLGRYPDATRARSAIAEHHGVAEQACLPTSGAEEAFTLIVRALGPARVCVVHPQFTEPEVAARAAGLDVHRAVLTPESGFALGSAVIPDEADLVFIGNPTNPTGVLHRASAIRRLARPGRVVVVDEAFADATPGEPESLLCGDLAGFIVVRSLTKTWGLAGLRAGYVVGEPHLIARLATQQPHWSVSTPAALAIERCLRSSSPGWPDLAAHRDHLIAGLRHLGLDPVPSEAPFVLVRAGVGVHDGLRAAGFAVRRCDSFPGLGPDWVRIAVRPPELTDALLAAWRGQS